MSQFVFHDPVFILDQPSYEDGLALVNRDADIVSAEARATFNERHRANFQAEPVHSDTNIILIENRYEALLWQDPEDRGNPNAMLAVMFELRVVDGKIDRKLAGVIAGEEFQGVLEYRQSARDAGMSALVFIANENSGVIEVTERDSALSDARYRKIFESAPQGIERNSHTIAHIYGHATGMACNHSHDNLPKAMPVFG